MHQVGFKRVWISKGVGMLEVMLGSSVLLWIFFGMFGKYMFYEGF